MSKLANFFLSLAESFAFGSKKRIVIGEHRIYVEYVSPKDTESYIWEDLYENAGLYIKDCVNPIYLEAREIRNNPEYDLITTERYKTFMKQNVVEQMFTVGEENLSRMELLQMAVIGVLIIIAVIMIMQ